MRQRIDDLERRMAALEPTAEQRATPTSAVQGYAEAFLEALPEMDAFVERNGADPFAGTKPPRALVNAVSTRAAQKVVHLYLETNSLRADYNRAVKRGGKILSEPMKMPWGDREFTLRDPNGYVVHLLQPGAGRKQ